MIGIACLDEDLTRLFAAPCPASGLRNLLEGAFGGAQIPALKPQIGVDHPDQSQFGKMIALRHQLRADDDVDRLILDT